ncbi:MAG: branched-chain amino acid transport system substrate-binding protein [Marinobacter psychrophilus]|jgi:branched-chain amino acid transport system substrate-binding protein|uniref:ABC transporter substrate-binding protein n=1 Tax=Marinobacter psychrophilus TaxID=330734 RepID=UPI0039E2C039
MKHSLLTAATVACAITTGGLSLSAHAADEFKLGLVTFLSGAASGPFGIPAKNAADLVIEAINNGTLPAPIKGNGIDGRMITPVYLDEAGGATKQTSEFRNLVERDGVDAVVGYISSGDCLAIPSVAEELKTLTVLFDCGTPRVFEEADYKYVFRTASTASMDNIAAARYVNENLPELKTIAGINQNYSWGHDSWRDFTETLKILRGGDIEITTEQFPKLFAGQYGAEISALQVNSAEVIHTSFWGGDTDAFVLQAAARGLLTDNEIIFTAGETALNSLGEHLPDGAIIGARGPFGPFAPESELNTWFQNEFTKRFGSPPTFPAYHMAQALIGLKLAHDKAGVGASTEKVISSFEGLEFYGPGGKVEMNRGKGHQAATEMVYGRVKRVDGEITFTDIIRYPADCVNPPEGTEALKWIQAGMPGAECN